jgi:hypothetical protein
MGYYKKMMLERQEMEQQPVRWFVDKALEEDGLDSVLEVLDNLYGSPAILDCLEKLNTEKE